MNNTNYLYGAAVQGIQSFIFQTDKIKEIVGASELVDRICTSSFDEFGGNKNNSILRAAGNIKHIFSNKEECEKAVRNFPKKVMTLAPGITISQAVVKMEGEFCDFSKAVEKLEQRLREQRNKPSRSLTIGLTGINRSRQTGLPTVAYEKNEPIDIATLKKRSLGKTEAVQELCKNNFGEKINSDLFTFDIDKITGNNDWIAIIHIDGNGLGNVVQKIGRNPDIFKDFSQKLDESTKAAAVSAYNKIKSSFSAENHIPIRPIVLSGDDHTLICRGDLAIAYTQAFLDAFEKETRAKLHKILYDNKVFGEDENQGLTACAGITYVKSSYPFYYGYSLSEKLCSAAKKDAKNSDMLETSKGGIPQSCLMFHKVQDSFTENYKDIIKRELTPQEDISFNFGPYYLNNMKNRWTIDELLKNSIDELKGDTGKAIKSHLRQWMTLLYDNEEVAKQKIKRLLQQKENNIKFIIDVTTKSDRNTVPVYDMLAINTIQNQKTKESK